MNDAKPGDPVCGATSPITNVPCQKSPGHSDQEGHGADEVVMPDGRRQPLTWGVAKRQ